MQQESFVNYVKKQKVVLFSVGLDLVVTLQHLLSVTVIACVAFSKCAYVRL